MASVQPVLGTESPNVKPDPDVKPEVLASIETVKIKYEREDPDYGGVDSAIPILDDDDDMFDDVEEEIVEDGEDGPIEDEIVDLTYEGLVHIGGIEHFVCRAFKIRQIPQPEVRMIDLGSLFGCLEYGSIVLTPDYQRETVWDEHRASTLINSISMGYFVPPIIFNRKLVITQTPDGKKPEHKKVCVDGKQRLTSLHKFMTGQIGIWDSNNPQKKWYFCHPMVDGKETNSTHNIMPQAVKEFFMSRRLCCYEYEELSKDTEENMFQLVQRGIALTPAEKMRAMSTEWATFAKQYEEDYAIVVNLSKQNRASGFRSILTIFAMIQEVMADRPERKTKSSAPALQASPQALNKLLEDKEPINPVLKLKIKGIFDKIENLVKLSSTQMTATRYRLNRGSVFDPAPDFLREESVSHVRTFSPLELIGTAILVSYHMEIRSDEELLNDVKNLRYYLRVKHKDLRVNPQCWNTTWGFISSLGTDAELSGAPRRSISRTKPTRKAPTRAHKLAKMNAGSRVTKQKTAVARRKLPSKPVKSLKKSNAGPVGRPRRRILSSAPSSSSALSSAPSSAAESSDESSDEEFMSRSKSPLFPSLVSNTTGSISHEVKRGSLSATERGNTMSRNGSIEVVIQAANVRDVLPGIMVTSGAHIPTNHHLSPVPTPDITLTGTEISSLIHGELADGSTTPAIDGEINLLDVRAHISPDLSDKEPSPETKQEGLPVRMPPIETLHELSRPSDPNRGLSPSLKIGNCTSSYEGTQSMDTSRHGSHIPCDVRSPSDVAQEVISEQRHKEKPPQSHSNIKKDVNFREGHNISKPVQPQQPAQNVAFKPGPSQVIDLTGVNPPPKPKSRFKPKVPFRDIHRPHIPNRAVDNAPILNPDRNGRPLNKRPYDGIFTSGGPSPKRPKDSFH